MPEWDFFVVITVHLLPLTNYLIIRQYANYYTLL